MMKKVIIFGLTDLSVRISHHIFQDSQYEIVAYTVEREYMQEQFSANQLCRLRELRNIILLICLTC